MSSTDPDETEVEILSLLDSNKPLSYNEIVERVGRKVGASSPKISRRLRRLVESGLVRREITDDWPPRSMYSIRTPEPDAPSDSRKSLVLKVLVTCSLILTSWAISFTVRMTSSVFLNNFFLLFGPIAAGVYVGIRSRSNLEALCTCLAAAGAVTLVWTPLWYLDLLLLEMLQSMGYVFSGLFLLESAGAIPALVGRTIWSRKVDHREGLARILRRIRGLLSTCRG